MATKGKVQALRPGLNRIALYGHFGAGNFGNECTIQAILHQVRQTMPDGQLLCICNAPEVVEREYGLESMSMTPVFLRSWTPQSSLGRFARKILVGIPSEALRWLRGVLFLRGTKMLIVVGTGLLSDAFGLGYWGPYSTFRWSVIARLCGCRLVFLSVGAGPIRRRFGMLLVRSALSLASFRSYRDRETAEYLKGIGFRAEGDFVHPDLAFSLPSTRYEVEFPKSGRAVVGVGVMLHAAMYGINKTTNAHYASYLEALAELVGWLLERNYDVRLLIGDHMDAPAVEELLSIIKIRSGYCVDSRIVAEPITSTEDLLSQISLTSFVVATRFHNVLLALLLKKPSIAISFHHKCSALMDGMGLSDYCLDIRQLDRDRLIRQFVKLERNTGPLKEMIGKKVNEHRKALEVQYRLIFGMLFGETVVEDNDRASGVAARA